jgi:hypothetical protein
MSSLIINSGIVGINLFTADDVSLNKEKYKDKLSDLNLKEVKVRKRWNFPNV